MINKRNNKIDNAWNNLYNRLEQDGLLEEKKTNNSGIFSPVSLRWIAGVAIICICAAIAFMFYKSPSHSQKEMFTLNNTDATSNLVTTLEDGSVVYLTNEASLSYPKHFDSDKREVFLQGEAFFDIHKNKSKPFLIETELIKIEVLGTAFNVKNKKKDAFSLSVLRGEVRVTIKESGEASNIKSGQTVLLNNNSLQTIKTPVTERFDGYSDKMHFKDERLEDIINVINTNSDSTKIELKPELNNRLLTVTFINENMNTMAELITLALNLRYEQKDNMIRIYN